MYGAIIGDVAGSFFEVLEVNARKNNKLRSKMEKMLILDKKFPLFNPNYSSCTDDSVLTTAIADAILSDGDYEKKLREYGLYELSFGNDIYNRDRFGQGFIKWLNDNAVGDSYGNGCAMRISPVGFLFDDISKVKEESKKATIITHNHKESILCAEAVAVSIFLLRNGYSKDELRKYIEENYFSLDFNYDDLVKNYYFKVKAINSVPQAIYCFIKSNDFEDAIRKAISIGGDSDTIASITGSLAEAYYGVPQKLVDDVKPYIKDYMIPVIDKFYNKEKVKKYIRKIY